MEIELIRKLLRFVKIRNIAGRIFIEKNNQIDRIQITQEERDLLKEVFHK